MGHNTTITPHTEARLSASTRHRRTRKVRSNRVKDIVFYLLILGADFIDKRKRVRGLDVLETQNRVSNPPIPLPAN